MKFETSNVRLFEKYKHSPLQDRLDQLQILRNIGFKIGTGVIVDLPGTTIEDMSRDLALLELIRPDMASASVFSPNSESRLLNAPVGNPERTLMFIAMMRKTLGRNTQMISCSSSLGKHGIYRGIMAGANVMSYHATPADYIDRFSSYRAKNRVKNKIENIELIAEKCGMVVAEYE